jgi:ABC-type antimicrobial peptide transport system permease subunit
VTAALLCLLGVALGLAAGIPFGYLAERRRRRTTERKIVEFLRRKGKLP